MSVYLITGCGRGIGRAMTEHLLSRGDTVVGSVRSGAGPVADERFQKVTFDVRDQESINAAVAEIDGPVDVLVNNAGVMGPESDRAYDADVDELADALDVNVLGPLRVIQACLPLLRRSTNAKVMTISSQLGSMTFPGSSHIAYRTTKAAVNKLMQGIAIDLNSEGIPLVIAHPGWVRTDMGGASAPLDPADSARGLVKLLDELTIEATGRFMDWDGSERDW
jgi:NAD(P)-dependent dehydrogenase (short-subunit alcohol dehydrogenase family)